MNREQIIYTTTYVLIQPGRYQWPCGCKAIYDGLTNVDSLEIESKMCRKHREILELIDVPGESVYDLINYEMLSEDYHYASLDHY